MSTFSEGTRANILRQNTSTMMIINDIVNSFDVSFHHFWKTEFSDLKRKIKLRIKISQSSFIKSEDTASRYAEAIR